MTARHKIVLAPVLLEQLKTHNLVDQAQKAIRDAMHDPEQAGRQLSGALYPYRRLKVRRYRIIYRVVPDADPPEVRFLYCAIRKEGAKDDVYRQMARLLQRGGLQ